MTPPPPEAETMLVPLSSRPAAEVERLLDRAFGADRHERTAYRVRGSAAAIEPLCFAAIANATLLGSIQCWPVALAGDDGRHWPLVMVGPVAVEPAHQQHGVGRQLVARALAAAAAIGVVEALMLIGDPEYYGRFFGFSAAATGGWRLPGPVERRRLLARGASVPTGTGLLGPRVAQPCSDAAMTPADAA